MLKRKVFFIILIFVATALHAQRDYRTGIGARLSPSSGLTVKSFISDASAIEGIISFRWQGFIANGLYETHRDAFKNNNFNFYYGFGGHFGVWDNDWKHHPWYDDGNDFVALGADGIIGVEYTFEKVPFNIALDWKPMFNIIENTDLWVDDVGLSIRFILK